MRDDDRPVAQRPGPFVLARRVVSLQEFVRRWEPLYAYKHEGLYDRNVGRPLTAARVVELFVWKNGGPLAGKKMASITRNYIDRLPELRQLDPAASPDAFLELFDQGGAIWRIYWLHLWQPGRYPIYDQHVHRAMVWIENGKPGEIPASDHAKVTAYLSRYLPFYELFRGIDPRRVDKALWACGKSMKPLTSAPVE